MNLKDKIYIAGHRGMVGSAILRQLEAAYEKTIVTRTHEELDLTDQLAVRDFMQAEIGMDVTAYEDSFFDVIENLMKLYFNKHQLGLIQTYLYQLLPDKEWDGTITLEKKGKSNTVPFKTADEVWEVIKNFT